MIKFGKCTSTATFGSPVLDIVDVTLGMDIQTQHVELGGVFRSLSGAASVDRIGIKRKWDAKGKPYRPMTEWWPVLRIWETYVGPYMFYDPTRPSLLTDKQKLLTSWTNSAGTALTPRADGGVNVAASGTAWMGAASNTDRTLLIPVNAGGQYFFGASVYGVLGWQAALTVAWYGPTGTAALSTTAVGTWIKASALSQNRYLDGTVKASRCGGRSTAPAGAAYAQMRWTVSNAAADIVDPTCVPGPSDPGNSWFLVTVDSMPETAHIAGVTSLSLTMTEA